MRKYILIVPVLFLLAGRTVAQDTVVSYKILQTYDRMFYNTNHPFVEVAVRNAGEENAGGELTCTVQTDRGVPVYVFGQRFSAAPGDSARLSFLFSVSPGFYRVSLTENGKTVENCNIGYEPEKIVSEPDRIPGLQEYWNQALKELAAVLPGYKVSRVKKTEGKLRDTWHVKMTSLGNVTIEGYYIAPRKKGVYPAVITCIGYGQNFSLPESDSDRIDFIVSTRQGALRDEAYFRGAYMDLVRAVDFLQGRNEVLLKNIFVQGTGSGGALALAACALDKRIAACVTYAPGFPDYGAEVPLRATVKNLAPWIECPVVMGVGLQDEICPPYSNFLIYNLIPSFKEYYVFIAGEKAPALWKEVTDVFYQQYEAGEEYGK